MCQPLTCGEQLLRAIALRAKVPLTNVGRFARCLDVLMVSDGRVACLECQTEFRVPWIGEARSVSPNCEWSLTAGAFHSSFEHQDLLGAKGSPRIGRSS